MSLDKLEKLTKQVQELEPHEQLLLVEQIVSWHRFRTTTQQVPAESESETWAEGELEQLMAEYHPLSTREFVEAGLFGGWEDMGIEDSLEWVQQQRAKTKNRSTW
jgi:hypothetical protein